MDSRVVAKFDENRPLCISCQNTHAVADPGLPLPLTLPPTPTGACTCTKFGRDRLRFGGVIRERDWCFRTYTYKTLHAACVKQN